MFLTIAVIGVFVYLRGGISVAYINGDTEALEETISKANQRIPTHISLGDEGVLVK